MKEVRKGPVEQFFEFPEPQMVEQLVDVQEIVVELAVSSGEAGSSWPRGRDTTPPLQQSKRLLVKLDLLGSHSTVPRQNPE